MQPTQSTDPWGQSAGLHGAPDGATALARGLLQADTPDVPGKLLQAPGPRGVRAHSRVCSRQTPSLRQLQLRHTRAVVLRDPAEAFPRGQPWAY